MTDVPDYPSRQHPVSPIPKPSTPIERTCRSCGASFLQLAPGKTGERGLWNQESWWACSQECYDKETHERRIRRDPQRT